MKIGHFLTNSKPSRYKKLTIYKLRKEKDDINASVRYCSTYGNNKGKYMNSICAGFSHGEPHLTDVLAKTSLHTPSSGKVRQAEQNNLSFEGCHKPTNFPF